MEHEYTMELPREIILAILHKLPRHTLARCSLLSRAWYSLTQPLLYESLYFCSKRQLALFINAHDSTDYCANAVHHITLNQMVCNVSNEDLHVLQHICRGVVSLSVAPFPEWKQPEIVHKIRPLLSKWKNINQVTVVPDDGDDNDIINLLRLKANLLNELRITSPFSFSLPRFDSLQSLYLTLNNVDRDLETGFWRLLNEACPSLKTLQLGRTRRNAENDGIFDISHVTPMKNIVNLVVEACQCVKPVPMYRFFAVAFPNIRSLDIDVRLQVENLFAEVKPSNLTDHQAAFYTMVTSFKMLDSLRVAVNHEDTTQFVDFDHIMPTCRMMESWLSSQQLTALKWWFTGLFKLDNNSNNRNFILPRYFDHLADLEVRLTKLLSSQDLLRYLLLNNSQCEIPSQLRTLSIEGMMGDYYDLNIIDWAKACPQLKTLNLVSIHLFKLKQNECSEDDNNNNNSTSNNNSDAMHPFSRLITLTLEDCTLEHNGSDERERIGLTDIVKLCPAISILRCNVIRLDSIQKERRQDDRLNDTQIIPYATILDVPDVTFEELYLTHIQVYVWDIWVTRSLVPILEFHLVESLGGDLKRLPCKMHQAPAGYQVHDAMLIRCREVAQLTYA